MRVTGIVFLALVSACASAKPRSGTSLTLSPACSAETHFDGTQCSPPGSAQEKVQRARAALKDFDVDTALGLLQAARAEGPHDHALLISLYEQLAITYAYLKREAEALATFEELLVLDPGHLLSYTLSPQATFLFERARTASENRARTLIDVSWPQNLREDESVPLAVEVVADPMSMLRRMALHVRSDPSADYQRVDFELKEPGALRKIQLPAPHTQRPTTLQIYGSAYDAEGNEVLLWFDAKRPREIPLGYQAPSPWYRKWWVWAGIGGVLTVGTGTTVYLLGLEPPDAVGGGFSIASPR